MRDLSQIDIWRRSFGLLPIHLNSITMEDKFLMLNGGHGDFCLQTNEFEEDRSVYFSQSWSANTKNYVVVDKTDVKVINWLKGNQEVIPRTQIENNFDKFYNYLLSKSYKTENDVIPFIIDIFRKLRNITREKEKPTEALNLLFRLLISLEDDYRTIDSDKWNIAESAIPYQFDYFVEILKHGVNSIKPQLDLILRHSAGALFQEAHKEALYFKPQRDLFGNVSSNLITKKELYTSIHYTPQYLARSIVENSIRLLDLTKESIKIFDPACGSSEFLIEALKQIKNKGYRGKILTIGWDTSESAVNTSNFLLKYEKRTQWDNVRLEYDIRLVNDSLVENWCHDCDLILMNPPFVSWELLKDKSSKDAVLETLGGSFKKGKPNQSSAFFYKAVQALNDNGVIGCVLPTSILTFDSYALLRNQVEDSLTISLIGKLGNFVFEDALTDVSFFIGQKPKSTNIPTLLWSKNEKGVIQDALRDLRRMTSNNQLTVEEKNYSIYTPSFFPIVSENWKIISWNENNFLKDLSRFIKDGKLTEASNIFSVQQGIRQGKKDVFKINNDEYNNIENNFKKLFRPVVDNDAIKNGVLYRKNYIWYPYDKNGIIFKNEEELKNIPFFINRIKPFEEQLKERAGIKEWWGHTRPRNWQFLKCPKLVSTEFGKSDSFAFDKDGQYVVERGNAWIPKKEFVLDDYYFYLACFSSSIFDQLLSIYSKQLAGGNWYDLGAKYTKNIPIPNIHISIVKESDAFSKLVELGKELESGNSYVNSVIDEILRNYFYPQM